MAAGSGKVGTFQPAPELAKRLAAMTYCCFFRTFDFRERAAVRRVEEDRVVAESVRAARLPGDFALDRSRRLEYHLPAVGHGDMRDESRRARRQRARGGLAIDDGGLRRVTRAGAAARSDRRGR